MSFVSNGSLKETTTPYIGIAARSGFWPNAASRAAARSSASGRWRNISQTGGAPGGSGPCSGWRSKSPRQVTDRSPRMLMVPRALTWPALGMPTIMPNCCCTDGSDAVASMRPNSSGGPVYLSRSGRIADGFSVWGWKADRSLGSDNSWGLRHRFAIFGDEHAADPVVGAHAVDIVLHDSDAGG